MTDLPDTDALKGLLVEVTPGPWRSVAMGGSSTVLTSEMPPRNDQRANCTYGFRGEEFCVAYPFIEDDGRSFRIDFVCFGHADARLIALAPSLAARVIEQDAALAAKDARIAELEAALRLVNSRAADLLHCYHHGNGLDGWHKAADDLDAAVEKAAAMLAARDGIE